ncbi:membrane protein insertion efficiency factor YidD [Paenibacillus sp. CGMCC 1.16610]|uniref:Putative membrane protein insertion efficiency factor n=2 Tax=Paenibacillus TaxID=44249 RepID=A0ABW9UAC9_9BACL|nr:membrane protein insertion efficiency factor YidD [Paenibacillus sp. CGMCC 1.16610]MVQ35961.1 membrane protein insertion efficiency factor YidD [Paenibacillus anseongense]
MVEYHVQLTLGEGERHHMKRTMQAPIHFYRKFISPLKPPTCRFYPTCSQYALEAIEVHGPLKGSWLSMKRICKCHPFHPGGIDHVPPRAEKLIHNDQSA